MHWYIHRNAIYAMMENHEALYMLVFHHFMMVLPHFIAFEMQQEKWGMTM